MLTVEFCVNISGFILFVVWSIMYFNYWSKDNLNKIDPDYNNAQIVLNTINDPDINIYIVYGFMIFI